MNANRVREFQDHLISPSFLEFCESQDQPVQRFERIKADLYFRSIGYSKKMLTEIDEQFALEDLSLSFKKVRALRDRG